MEDVEPLAIFLLYDAKEFLYFLRVGACSLAILLYCLRRYSMPMDQGLVDTCPVELM